MSTHALEVGKITSAAPGDEFTFASASTSAQYHFSATTSDPVVIGVWSDSTPHQGLARNKPGKPYVDHVTGMGAFLLTVEGPKNPYTISVTVNPWWVRIFGSLFR